MSVAKCLGVDDFDGPNMRGVRVEWPRWQQIEPVLAVVDDFEHLPRWLKRAQPGDRDAVLAAMLRIADTEPPRPRRIVVVAHVRPPWSLGSCAGLPM